MRIGKFKKRLKGMTLIEIIVSLALFTVMSGVLLTACLYVNRTISRTNKLTNKVNYQSPIAENEKTEPENVSVNTGKIRLKIDGGASAYDIDIIQYEVKSKHTDASKSSYDDDIASNFKYFEVAPATTTTP